MTQEAKEAKESRAALLMAAILILFLIVAISTFFPLLNDGQKMAEEEYLGKTVELVSPEPPYQAQLKVQKVYADSLFWGLIWKINTLYGILVIEQPAGAEYLGYAPGSSAISWRLRDSGKGVTWMPEFRLKGSSGYTRIRITGVQVK